MKYVTFLQKSAVRYYINIFIDAETFLEYAVWIELEYAVKTEIKFKITLL